MGPLLSRQKRRQTASTSVANPHARASPSNLQPLETSASRRPNRPPSRGRGINVPDFVQDVFEDIPHPELQPRPTVYHSRQASPTCVIQSADLLPPRSDSEEEIIISLNNLINPASRAEMLCSIKAGTRGAPAKKKLKVNKHRASSVDEEGVILSAEQPADSVLSAETFKKLNNKLDRAVRWNTLLIHTNANANNLVQAIVEGKISPDSKDYGALYDKATNNPRTMKYQVLQRMEKFVRTLMDDHDEIFDEDMNDDQNAAKLRNWLRTANNFTESDYFQVFYYIKDYVNYRRSAPLGQFFMKEIFVNLASLVYVNQIMDKKKRKTLLNAYDILALQPTFDNVSKDDFAEQAELPRKKQQGKFRDFTLAEAHFDLEVAPAKQPLIWSDGENDIEDEDLRML